MQQAGDRSAPDSHVLTNSVSTSIHDEDSPSTYERFEDCIFGPSKDGRLERSDASTKLYMPEAVNLGISAPQVEGLPSA